jgi:hypothetical protein
MPHPKHIIKSDGRSYTARVRTVDYRKRGTSETACPMCLARLGKTLKFQNAYAPGSSVSYFCAGCGKKVGATKPGFWMH